MPATTQQMDGGAGDQVESSLTSLPFGRDPVISRHQKQRDGPQSLASPSQLRAASGGQGDAAAQPADAACSPGAARDSSCDGHKTGSADDDGSAKSEAAFSGHLSSDCQDGHGNGHEGGQASAHASTRVLEISATADESINKTHQEISDAHYTNTEEVSDSGYAIELTDSAIRADSSALTSSDAETCDDDDFSGNDDDGASTGVSTPRAQSLDEASTDENKSKNAASDRSAKGPAASDSEWSTSEDHILRGMKLAALTWAQIGKALSRDKSHVKARWRAIQHQSDPADGYAAPRVDGPGDNGHASKGAKSKGSAKSGAASKWHKGKRNSRVASENKAARSKAAAANKRDQDILSGEEASSETSIVVDDKFEDDDEYDGDCGTLYAWPRGRQNGLQYLHNHVYRGLYPNVIDPEPDDFFGEHDCAVLAAMDSEYKRSRYLEMQANFYNATGRLVPLHMIRDRIDRAEERRARHYDHFCSQAAAARHATERRITVEQWVDSVQTADPIGADNA